MFDIDRALAVLIYVFVIVATIPLWLLLGIFLMRYLERRGSLRKQREGLLWDAGEESSMKGDDFSRAIVQYLTQTIKPGNSVSVSELATALNLREEDVWDRVREFESGGKLTVFGRTRVGEHHVCWNP
jgi:hypothetical protein